MSSADQTGGGPLDISQVAQTTGGIVTAPSGGTTGQPSVVQTAAIPDELDKILATITAVNGIREQIIRLGLNPALKIAIDTEVVPLLNILAILGTASYDFSVSAFNINNNSSGKVHEVKKLLELVYDISDLSESVFEVLEKLVLITLPKAPPK